MPAALEELDDVLEGELDEMLDAKAAATVDVAAVADMGEENS